MFFGKLALLNARRFFLSNPRIVYLFYSQRAASPLEVKLPLLGVNLLFDNRRLDATVVKQARETQLDCKSSL